MESSTTTRFLYDGAALIGEFNSSGAMLRRYVHGPGVDEPIVWYEGSGTSDRRWLVADERGSIVAVTNSSGAVTDAYSYDEYGRPNSWSGSRFRYTGRWGARPRRTTFDSSTRSGSTFIIPSKPPRLPE